jgi:hypothetical protein
MLPFVQNIVFKIIILNSYIMKKVFTLFAILIITLSTFGQRYDDDNEIKTLFGSKNFSSGGYGAFGAGYSIIDDKDAIVMTGRGVWLMSRSLGFGIAGTGFINDYHFDAVLEEEVNLTGGYGGLIIEPILLPRSPVHLAFPVTAGVGGIAYTRSNWVNDPWEYREAWVEDTETFLFVEPGVELELNLLKFFRLAFGVSYRVTTQIDLIDTPSDVLNGFTSGISFKFGKF